MSPFIEAKIKFADAAQTKGIWPIYPPYAGLIFKIGESLHDSRIFIDKPVYAGEERILGIWFLRPDLVMPKLEVGANFQLMTGEIIAEGVVLKILADKGVGVRLS